MRATLSFAILFPLLSAYVTTFSKCLLSAYSSRLHLKFLRKCLQEQVLPRSLLPFRLRKYDHHPFNEFSVMMLRRHIEATKLEERKKFKELSTAKSVFYRTVPASWKDVLLQEIYRDFHWKIDKLKQKLNNKLKNLVANSDWTKNARQDCVINLSSKSVSEDVVCALGFGLSFSLVSKPSTLCVASSLSKFEKSSDLSQQHIDMIRGIVYCSANHRSEMNFPARYKKSLTELRKDQTIHITKADKANSIVIMDKEDYISRMHALLDDNVTYRKLTKNPLDDVIKTFNSGLKRILKENKDLINQVSVKSPSLPYLYGLVKTHKENNPMRPIISSAGSVTYKLSKYITKLLSPFLGTISGSHIINSLDLVEKLNKVSFSPDVRLISFDVCSLFTKVPIDSILDYLNNELADLDLPLPLSQIIALTRLCICDCKFTFNGEYYQQIFGMAMGNPLSPLLSNLYMEFFERQHLPAIIPIPLQWYRYVDDILVVLPDSVDVNQLLAGLNNRVPSIKFTLECERDNCLPFLDVMIHRENFQCKYSIYRKPTNNLTYVHFYSGHHLNIKISIFSSMFLRALRIVSPEFLDQEFANIRKIGTDLCYPSYIMDKCLDKAKKKFYSTSNDNSRTVTKNTLVLPYFSGFESIKSLLKPFNVSLIFSYRNSVRDLLIKNSPKCNNNIIYHIPCMDCCSFYIGQTSKELKVRINQHKYSVRTGQTSNALFVHLSEKSHRINWSHSSVIARCNDFRSRNILESAIIQITSEHNCNLSPGQFSLDPLIISSFKKDLKEVISKLSVN